MKWTKTSKERINSRFEEKIKNLKKASWNRKQIDIEREMAEKPDIEEGITHSEVINYDAVIDEITLKLITEIEIAKINDDYINEYLEKYQIKKEDKQKVFNSIKINLNMLLTVENDKEKV